MEDVIVCEHDKCYAPYVFYSLPPSHPWICRKCKKSGVDKGEVVGEEGEYERLINSNETRFMIYE